MAKSKLVEKNEKIAEKVVGGYKKIEETVVGGYKKMEEGVVNGFTKMTDSFVDEFLTKDGETVEEAKERMRNEEQQRQEQRKRKSAKPDRNRSLRQAEKRLGKQEYIAKNSRIVVSDRWGSATIPSFCISKGKRHKKLHFCNHPV